MDDTNMNQQDESALVDSFFSPGGLLDPDKINQDDGNDADFPTTSPPLSQALIDVDHGFVVPSTQSTTITSTTHLPIWNSIFHHDAADTDIGAFSAEQLEQDAFINVTLPFHHPYPRHELFAPNNTTGQQGLVSPATEPTLLAVPALDHSELNWQQHYHYHAERIENAAVLYRHEELNVVYDSTMDNRDDDMNEEIWFSHLITGDCEFNRHSVITAGVQYDGTIQYQQDSGPFEVFHDNDQHEFDDDDGHGLKLETSHIVAENEEYDGNDTDGMARAFQPSLPLQLLKGTDSGDRSMSTTSSLSSTSSCVVQSEQPQNNATEEEEQEEVLPAVPSFVTTCSRRKRYNERLKRNDYVDDAAENDNNIVRDHDNIFSTDKNAQNISQSRDKSLNYSNEYDEDDKILNGILDDDTTNVGDEVRQEQVAIHEKTLVIPPPNPPPPLPKLKFSPEWNAVWSDAPTAAAKDVAVASDLLELAPPPFDIGNTRINSLPSNTPCCSSTDGGAVDVPLDPPNLAAGTPASSVREPRAKEPLQRPRKSFKGLSSRVQTILGAVTRTWRSILDRLVATARATLRLCRMLYSLVFLLCLESLGELKDHPSSVLCFAVFYATPRGCHVLMDLVNLPYWTPHVLSTVLVVSVCYPIQNASLAGTCSTICEGIVSKEHCDGSSDRPSDRDRSLVQRWEQQVSAAILWLIRLYMACLFFYDGFSDELGLLWRMNDMTRLLVASLLTLVRYERILSPVGWICWSVQVIVAALLPSCFATEVLVVLMALSSARYIRSSGLCTS